jgi:hypothetical protein
MKTKSTTALSKELGLNSKELFDKLLSLELIYRKNDKWCLTSKGMDVGGKIISSVSYGEFIVWPENFNPFDKNYSEQKTFINATKIGEKYEISNQRVNNILSELGYIEEAIKGWKITPLGRNIGGVQREHQSGGTYVIWPDSILTNRVFLKAIRPTEYMSEEKTEIELVSSNIKSENKYPSTLLKSKDGHLVRSRAELIIDNLLYDYGLTHAYERELTVEETVRSDFFIPARNGKDNKGKAVYIEFWGINDNDKYLERKKEKQEIYKKHKLNLIELDDSHIDNLDSFLRKAFLKFDINVVE